MDGFIYSTVTLSESPRTTRDEDEEEPMDIPKYDYNNTNIILKYYYKYWTYYRESRILTCFYFSLWQFSEVIDWIFDILLLLRFVWVLRGKSSFPKDLPDGLTEYVVMLQSAILCISTLFWCLCAKLFDTKGLRKSDKLALVPVFNIFYIWKLKHRKVVKADKIYFSYLLITRLFEDIPQFCISLTFWIYYENNTQALYMLGVSGVVMLATLINLLTHYRWTSDLLLSFLSPPHEEVTSPSSAETFHHEVGGPTKWFFPFMAFCLFIFLL
eukprot:GHVR01141065.1.p1 GENE.GHVR01141065.1~~GHVR01141065.1.p1  ORF type:complete len:270 (-),score=29.46 GHVR01141065.1:109-918(-)